MNTQKCGRKLTVLIVDDQPSRFMLEEGNAEFPHLDLIFIKSWAETQHRCATEGDLGGADILLIDVSFDKDPSISKLREREQGFVPVGPLLALPYIGKRAVMSCVTYSAHINNPALRRHPYFLLAMGLILARSSTSNTGYADILYSEHLSKNGDRFLLDQEVARLAKKNITQSLDALTEGLSDYRDRLDIAIKAGNITLANHHSLLSEISQLCAKIDDNNDPISCEGLQLRLSGHNWQDSINVQSLFADRMNKLGKWETRQFLNEVKEWVQDLGSKSPTEWALKVIESQNEAEAKEQPRPDVRETILQCMGRDASSDDLTETLRMCVLFANIWAMEDPDNNGRVTRQAVLSRLKERLDVNTYFDWFGVPRTNQTKRSSKHVSQIGAFKKLHQLSSGENKFARCFLSESSEINQDDYEAIQKYRAYEDWPEWRVSPFRIANS